MFTAQYLDGSAEAIREIFSGLQSKIMADIAKHIAGFAYIGHEAEYNNYKLQELTELQAYIAQERARTLKTTRKEVNWLFEAAGRKNLKVAIGPVGAKNADKPRAEAMSDFSERLAKVLDEGAERTLNTMEELCRSIAENAAFELNQYLDRCQLYAQAGINREQAAEIVIRDFAVEGLSCRDYGRGEAADIEAAVKRIFITGLNQALGKTSLELASILETDLVQVSGHADARPEHALWQYGIYSISGKSGSYRKLSEATGYGTGAGLCGWNCRHTFFPYIEGVTKRMRQEDYDPAVYEAEQKLRYYERQIRKWRLRASTLEAAGVDNGTELEKIAYWQVRRDKQVEELRNFELVEGINIAYGDNLPYNGISGDIALDPDKTVLSTEPVLGNIGGVVESNREYIRNMGIDPSEIPSTAEEHWARNELNYLPSSDIEYYEDNWKEMVIGKVYHHIGKDFFLIRKFLSPDGHREAVFYGDKLLLLDENQPNYENLKDNAIIDPVNAGTYNYYPVTDNPLSQKNHYIFDVEPYLKWGNCSTDTSTHDQRNNPLFW